MAALFDYGVRYVAVTDGVEGSYLGSPDAVWYCPVVHVAPLGSAGAGDAFSATLAAYLAGGAGPQGALQAASVNSASVVGFVDTQSGLLNAPALEQKLREQEGELIVSELLSRRAPIN